MNKSDQQRSNGFIMTADADNCIGSVPVDAVQLPSTEPTIDQCEQNMLDTKSKLWRQCCITNERAWLRWMRGAYRTHEGVGGRCSTSEKELELWNEYFVTALHCGHDVKADIAELEAWEKAERKKERQRTKAEARRKEEEQQRWREENPEAYAEQLKQQELARQQLEGSKAQPQKQKRGKRGKDRQQRSTNPKAWINDIAQLGFKGVQLQIALHIIGLCRKAHDQGKGGCGINRKRVQERYERSLRTVEVVIQKLRDAGVITVERAKPQLKQKYGEQYGQFGKTSLTEAFRNGTWQPQPQPQPQPDSTAASEPKTAAKAAVRTIFCEKISDPSDQLKDNQSQGRSTAENTPKAAIPLDLSSSYGGRRKIFYNAPASAADGLGAATSAVAAAERTTEGLPGLMKTSEALEMKSDCVDQKPAEQPSTDTDEAVHLIECCGPLQDVLEDSEELSDLCCEPLYPFGSNLYVKMPGFGAPTLARICTAEELQQFNKSRPVDHLLIKTIVGVEKTVPAISADTR